MRARSLFYLRRSSGERPRWARRSKLDRVWIESGPSLDQISPFTSLERPSTFSVARSPNSLTIHCCRRQPYWPDSRLGAGFGAGLAFLAGLETPKLIRKKLNPLRSESSTLIVSIPIPDCFQAVIAQPGNPGRVYFPCTGAMGAMSAAAGRDAGRASPRRIVTAAGGSGLPALANSRLTCHIWASVSTCL